MTTGGERDSLWIFGYGSLVWRPAFPHLRARPACIRGFVRRFWQGSTDHRGIPGQPGRVVTLVDNHNAQAEVGVHTPSRDSTDVCWGTAYEVPRSDPEGVLAGLDHRERGGYDRVEVEVEVAVGVGVEVKGEVKAEIELPPVSAASAFDHDVSHGANHSINHGVNHGVRQRMNGLVYIAGPENENYLGPASVEAIAAQVAHAHGPSGANPEYVFELAHSLRAMQAHDEHVFAIEAALERVLSNRGVVRP